MLASQTTGAGTSAAATTTFCYDPSGDQTAVVAPNGSKTGTAGCETSSPWIVNPQVNQTQAEFQTTSSYDSEGELVSTASPATTATPNGATTTFGYDAVGNQLTSTDPNGVTATSTYTPANQLASTSYSASSAPPVTNTYDADGDKTAMADGTGTFSYQYDPFSELTSAENGAGKTTGYSYDGDGDLAGVTYPLPASATWATSDTVSYGYDHADVMTSVTDFEGHQMTITPNADGLPASETLGTTGDTVTKTYDGTDSLSAITLKNASGTLQSFAYSGIPAGNYLTETFVWVIISQSRNTVQLLATLHSRHISHVPGNTPPTDTLKPSCGVRTSESIPMWFTFILSG